MINDVTSIGDTISTFFNDFWNSLVTNITQVFNDLFYFDNVRFTQLLQNVQTAILSRFGNLMQLQLNASSSSVQSINIPFIYGATISLDWFLPYAQPFRTTLSGFIYLLTAFYVIQKMGDLYS